MHRNTSGFANFKANRNTIPNTCILKEILDASQLKTYK